MRRFVLSLALGLSTSLALSTPTLAGPSKSFKASVQSLETSNINIDVVIGEDLAHRANNSPNDITERRRKRRQGSGPGLRRGFSGNGHYGERDVRLLGERLERNLAQQLTKRGLTVDDSAPVTLKVTLTKAIPNRPTFEQLSREINLSFKSVSLGGASMEGELFDAAGNSLGTLTYAFYEDNFRDAVSNSTWTDAHRAFDRFARRSAKALTK